MWYIWYAQEILKGELGLFLTPVLTVRGGGHIDRHVWRRVIVPPDLRRSFGATSAHYRYRVMHCAFAFYTCVIYVHAVKATHA